LLNVGDSAFQLVGVLSADGNESGGAQDTVSRGEVGFLLENVVVLGALLRVLDLPDPLALGGVGDVLGLLLADVACGARSTNSR